MSAFFNLHVPAVQNVVLETESGLNLIKVLFHDQDHKAPKLAQSYQSQSY